MAYELPPRPEQLGIPADWLVVMPANGQIMFRMVKNDLATEDDFRSDRALGRPRFPADLEADHLGVSMFEEQAQAESIMRRYPKRLARVRLDLGYGICLARTLLEVAGHHTVWGLPTDLAGLVEFVSVDRGPVAEED